MALFLISNGAQALPTDRQAETFNNLMFGDVDKQNENFNAIYYLYNTGVIEGYEAKDAKYREYKPANKINRAEFLKLIMEGTGKAKKASYESCFPDVKGDKWYTTYVCQAKEEGIVKGYPDGTFKPEQTINEAEALKILGELLDWELESAIKEDPWYKPYYDFAATRNIVPVEKVDTYMTRADIAEMIFRNAQVDELKVKEFDTKLVDEMFYKADVPYAGPMGPNGLFGPGGPFGAAGAFIDGGYYANKDGLADKDGKFEVLGEDFYDEHFCYYSPDGDFRQDVDDTLNYITGGKIEDVELAGYDVDDFGVAFCYSGIAATDLQPLTRELMDEFNVSCWLDPIYSLSAQGTFDKLFCYAEPEEPEWLNEDTYCKYETDENGYLCTTCYENILEENVLSKQCNELEKGPVVEAKELEKGKNLYIEINGIKDFTAGDDANLEIFLTDNDGVPIRDRNLKMLATTGIDYFKKFEVKEAGMGVYKVNFPTKLAGLYILTVIDEATGIFNDVTLRVNAGPVDHIQVVDTLYPNQSIAPNKASVRIVSKDKYDNTVPISDNNILEAVTNLGKVESFQDDDIFNFEVTADDWGTAELGIMYKDQMIGDKIKFDFFPIQVDMPKGISADDKVVEAPVYLYFPKKYGPVGSFDFKINYNLKGLQLDDFVDFDEKDKILMPYYEIQNGFIHIWQPLNEANSNEEVLPLGNMLFNVTSVGDGTILVGDAVLKDGEGSSKFTHEGSGQIEGFSGGIWGGTHVVKPTKNICVEAFVLPLPPGTGGAPLVAVTPAATEAEIAADVAQTNAIFAAIARSCNCNFFLNVTLRTPVTNLSYPDVDAFDANHNGVVESDGAPGDAHVDEIDNMMANHPSTPGCIATYYVPQINSGSGKSLLGLSRNSATSNGVIINNSLDADGRTLAHELAHQLSKGDVSDPHDPDAHAEGADQAGNLMNYTHTGDNLTPLQCSEIEALLP